MRNDVEFSVYMVIICGCRGGFLAGDCSCAYCSILSFALILLAPSLSVIFGADIVEIGEFIYCGLNYG